MLPSQWLGQRQTERIALPSNTGVEIVESSAAGNFS